MSVDLSHAPHTGATRGGLDHTSPERLTATVERAAAAYPVTSAAAPAQRRRWLHAVADALESEAAELVRIADEETALGEERLRGELAKTAANARYYGAVGEAGHWLRARVQRLPGPPALDLRRAALPIGVVAVFGASNFPFQFGTVGHDTCSALAVGCPVVVKAHPAHPRLARALFDTVSAALADAGAPAGTFGMVVGFAAGLSLVRAPQVSAVAFTGSQAGGMALVEAARQRPYPIPVFAEMGTVNPVVVTPAGAGRAADVAAGFVDSFTLGCGQFCTKPGLLLVPRGSGLAAAIARRVAPRTGGWLLTAAIADAFRTGVRDLLAAGAQPLAEGQPPDQGYVARPVVLSVPPASLQAGSRLLAECFGPMALVCEYSEVEEACAVLSRLQPSLAGSVFGGGDQDPHVPALVAQLSRQTGRVIVDGWPTGVACVDAMHHGGPWPATSRPDATSVGAEALARFTRPVSFQNVPDAALPAPLREANPWGLTGRDDERAAR